MTRLIRGAGGGKGGSNSARVPVESKDSLRSKAFAKVLDLVSEGEIDGLVDGLKSVYLDGTPIQNADGSFNFTGVELTTRTGTQAQTSIPGFPAVEVSIPVSVKASIGVPVVRQITNPNTDAVRVTVGIPQLTFQNPENGDLTGTEVRYAIDLQSNGGGFVPQLLAGSTEEALVGKTTTRYQRSYRIELTGSPPWDIRLRRVTADSTQVNLQNETWFDAYTEIIDAKLRYPNSALAGLKVDASQFQAIPTRGYEVKLLRVQVPTNYDPVARTYTGSWNGTFKIAWTDNPAWCFYDLVTNDRYGLGGLVDAAQVDKWALYQIGRYCDELVPNGFGGTEPRFTCNMYLQTRAEAFKVLQDMASIFRGMVYWSTGAITAVQDAPTDPVALFTPANVIEGKFSYAGSSLKARHTVALVTWNDPDDLYRQKVEYVEDEAGIIRYGIQQTDVVAVGCTSRGQANRVGRWLLFSERLESETVQFSVGLDGAVVRPGHVIKVADSARAGARLGGRVRSATSSAIVVDVPPSVSITGWTLYCTLADGTVESRTVSSLVGNTINVTAFTSAPVAESIWILSSSTVEAQTFRVVAVAEDAETGHYAITALKHEPLKYAAVEQNLVLQPRDITLLSVVPQPPKNGSVTESLYQALTDVKVQALFSWEPPTDGTGLTYEASYRVGSNNFTTVNCPTQSLQLLDAQPGQYTVSVKSVSAIGVKSQPYTFVVTVFGKSALPADITGLQMTAQGESGILQWDLHEDLDVRIGGQIAVRYSEQMAGATWNTSLPIAEFPGSATSGTVPLRAGTYLAKGRDSTGNLSANAALVVTDAANLVQFNAVASSTQDPTFLGTKTGLVVIDDRLQLDQQTLWDSISDLDAYTDNLDGGLLESGEYEFDTYVDTGAVYTSRVAASFALVSFNVANLVDDWPPIDELGAIDSGQLAADFVDTWADWDAIVNFDTPTSVADATLQIYISTTNDNPASSPVWSAWRLFYVGDYTARAFRFKVRLIRGPDENNQVALTTLGVTVDVPDRVESANNIVVPAAGRAITYANAFFAVPAVAVTAENMATGDYATITSKTASGFTIQFRNSAGTGVERTMDWIAKGFGYYQN